MLLPNMNTLELQGHYDSRIVLLTDEIMLKKLGFRMGSKKHIQAPLLHQSQWVLLTDRQKVWLHSKYEGFKCFLDGTDTDMLRYTDR